MSDSIFDYVAKGENFKTLRSLIPLCDDLQTKLSTQGEYTFFVPTDEAFAKLPPGSIEALHNDTDRLQDALFFHVLSGIHKSDELVKMAEEGKTVMAVDHNEMKFVKKGESLWAGSDKNKGKVITPDVELSNGVIHVVDEVFGFNE